MLIKVSSTARTALDLLIKALKILSSMKVSTTNRVHFTKLCQDTLKAIDNWFLEVADEKGVPADQLPEDFSITGMVTGIIRKYGLSGADVEEVQAEVLSSLPDWLDRFDPERGKLTNMLYRNIKSRVFDYKARQKKEREHVAPLVREEEEGGVIEELIPDIRETAETESEFRSLVQQIRDFIKKPRLRDVLDRLLKGETAQQIQEDLGISRGYISQITEAIRQEVVDFARQTDNPELESAAEAIRKKYFVRSTET